MIDVTKSVSIQLFPIQSFNYNRVPGLLQGPRIWRSPRCPMHRSCQTFLKVGRAAYQGRRWRLPADRLNVDESNLEHGRPVNWLQERYHLFSHNISHQRLRYTEILAIQL